eukprot:m.95706 g.95706  ORF g.95706 m.95706 type:complete len:63 (-) comp12338_c0_seq1:1170-1358(-)
MCCQWCRLRNHAVVLPKKVYMPPTLVRTIGAIMSSQSVATPTHDVVTLHKQPSISGSNHSTR